MKKIISTASAATLLFAASIAIAQTGTSSPLRPLNAERRDAIRDQSQEAGQHLNADADHSRRRNDGLRRIS